MKHKKRNIVIIVVIVIAALAVGGAAGIYISELHNRDSSEGVTLDTDAKDYDSEDQSGTETIRFPGYSDITIGSEDTYIPVVLTNPEDNPCYFSFEVTVDDDTQPLLKTEWVGPGKAVTGIPLQQQLSQGGHKLNIKIDTRSVKTEEPMNSGNVSVNLNVK